MAANVALGKRLGPLRQIFMAVLALLAAEAAEASAWLQPEGRGRIIFSPSAMAAAQRFDRRGKPARIDRFVKQDTTTTVEYGLREDLTISLAMGARVEAYPVEGGVQRVMTSTLGGGARMALWRRDNLVVSAQLRAASGFERSLPALERRFGARHEVEVRLLAGYSFDIGGLPAFVEAQAGYRWRSAARADEAVLDFAVGIRPVDRLLVVLQLFNASALQRDGLGGSERPRQHKLQASAVFDITEAWSFQVGGFTSLTGREALREQGVLIGVWRKF
jgi:protein XagA